MTPTYDSLDDGRAGMWRDVGVLIARMGFGGTLILRHGITKIPVLLAAPVQFFDPLGLGPAPSLVLAIFAEVFCALAVLLGVFSRAACIPLIVNFTVITVVLHGMKVPEDRGELALLYLVAFLVLFMTGPGRFSLDQRMKNR